MTESNTQFIEPGQLRIGMFVYLDMGWMDHPFPVSSFAITTQAQIDTIRRLGLERVRYSPDKSKFQHATAQPDPRSGKAETPPPESPKAAAARKRKNLLASQQANLQACEKQFNHATQTFRQVMECAQTQPLQAKEQSEQLIKGFLSEILGQDEAAIRLLSENAGERTSLHSINVTVICLLLGQALNLPKADMLDLGLGALLHDIGKTELPDRMRWQDDHFSAVERQIYQEHVARGVAIARTMGLSSNVMLLIAQHHEFSDGTGYPNQMRDEKLSQISKIVALVNRYDNLCNPGNPALAVTPHEALSQIFTQHKAQFQGNILTAFIRMMGIYPPGSVVQLTDGRYAMVVSVNSARPIKPRVIIHDPDIPRETALVINLENEKQLGIQRSLKPIQLPKATHDYLSPRKRLCYFFERGLESSAEGIKHD
jgi:putative nucleotidyltransferase with HDIG domain